MNLLLHNSHQSQHLLSLFTEISVCLSNSTKRVLEYLDRYSTYYSAVEVSQERIAAQTGCCVRTVGRAVADLARLGFISKRRRYNNTSIYQIAEFLRSNHNRANLAFIFKWFKPYIHKTIEMITNITSSQESNVRLIVSKNIYNTLPVVSKTKICKYTGKNGESIFKKFPKRKEIESMDGIEVSQELRAVTKALNLTKWGQLKLSVFPDHILKHTLNELKSSKNAQNNFGWFISVAIKACDRERIKPNWEQYDFLKKKYQQPENAKMVIAGKKQADKPAPDILVCTEVPLLEQINLLEKNLLGWQKRLSENNPYDYDSPRKHIEGITREINELQRKYDLHRPI